MNILFWRRESLAEPVPIPSAKDPSRKLVLVESEDAAERWAIESILRASGFDAITCGGPHVLPGGRCPLVATGSCAAFEQADAVLFRLDLPDAADAAVLEAAKAKAGSTPVVVEIPEPRTRRLDTLLSGVRLLRMPAMGEDLVEALQAALARGERP